MESARHELVVVLIGCVLCRYLLLGGRAQLIVLAALRRRFAYHVQGHLRGIALFWLLHLAGWRGCHQGLSQGVDQGHIWQHAHCLTTGLAEGMEQGWLVDVRCECIGVECAEVLGLGLQY